MLEDLKIWCQCQGYSLRVSSAQVLQLRVEVIEGTRGPVVYDQVVEWSVGWGYGVIAAIEQQSI